MLDSVFSLLCVMTQRIETVEAETRCEEAMKRTRAECLPALLDGLQVTSHPVVKKNYFR